MAKERLFGLIGYPLGHSFSKKYFSAKFAAEGIADCRYELFPLAAVAEFSALLEEYPALEGINVTIPYKEAILPYLDAVIGAAQAIGAVNTIHRQGNRLVGHNTDVVGFERSLVEWLPASLVPTQALVLGTGGAAKAVVYVLEKMGWDYQYVSRQTRAGGLTYAALTPELLATFPLIINTTPLGTAPAVEECPPLPYAGLSTKHWLYDLVYNPPLTRFMQQGAARGAQVKNGLDMLEGQAEAAWAIWNPSL